jgi:uncharacterized protein (UPF0335 family)
MYKCEVTSLKRRIEQLEKEKAKLYDRCLENEEAMYDAVMNGSDNQMILLVVRRDKIDKILGEKENEK